MIIVDFNIFVKNKVRYTRFDYICPEIFLLGEKNHLEFHGTPFEIKTWNLRSNQQFVIQAHSRFCACMGSVSDKTYFYIGNNSIGNQYDIDEVADIVQPYCNVMQFKQDTADCIKIGMGAYLGQFVNCKITNSRILVYCHNLAVALEVAGIKRSTF